MNSTGRLSQKGSVDAAEYARDRKEKMERARQLREERKNGVSSSASSNVFKSAAERSVHRQRQGSQNRSQQHTQMSNANGQDTTATSMLSSPSIHGGRMNQDPFMGNHGGPQYGQQMQTNYSQMGYGNAASSGGFVGVPPQGGAPGHLATQQIFPGDNFMAPQMDAFSTPLNAAGGSGQMGNFGGPPPMHGGNQNFAPPHNMVSDGFLRNSNNNFSQMQQQREGVIVNSRTQDNYYHHQQQQPAMHRNRSMQSQVQNQQNPNMFSPGSNGSQLPPRHQQNFGAPQGYPSHSPGPQHHSGLQTIQHDVGYRQQTQIGFNSQNLQAQQEFGGFRSAAGTQYPGHLTPNRQTHYSQRDVNEARGSLTLLKKRMSNSRDRPQKNSTIEYSSSSNNPNQQYQQPSGQLEMGGHNSQSQRNSMQPLAMNGDRFGGQNQVPPRPPRVNQSQVYNDGALSGADAQSTPGGRSNYRKVFKPNIPGPRAEPSQQEELDLDAVNAIAPPQQARRQGVNNYEGQNNNRASQRSENQVLQSSPDRTRARVGLPPREKPQAMARKPQQSNGYGRVQHRQPQEEPQYQEATYEEPKPTNYNFDEDMQDPFGSKKAAVMNTPPKGNPMAQDTYGQPPAQKSNFHDELASGNSGVPEQPRENDSLQQCSTCERKFNAKALERHSKVCVKVFQTKRKAFDVAEQRKATDASGKGVEQESGNYGGRSGASYKPKMPGRKPASTAAARGSAAKEGPAAAGGKIPKWKLQSLQFRQAVGPVQSSNSGGGASNFNPIQEASIDTDDRVPCQFCGRKFAEKTAERHIPHCETKYKANLMKNGPPKATGAARRAPSKGLRR